MEKYIDADILRKEIEFAKSVYSNPNRVVHGVADAFRQDGRVAMCDDILKKIDSLQQEQPDEVLIPQWCLENIENTLRIQHNINNDAKDGETCQDRNIKESLNCVRKLLNGEEITGRERSEPLMKQPEVDLEKEVKRYIEDNFEDFEGEAYVLHCARHFYELGLIASKEE